MAFVLTLSIRRKELQINGFCLISLLCRFNYRQLPFLESDKHCLNRFSLLLNTVDKCYQTPSASIMGIYFLELLELGNP